MRLQAERTKLARRIEALYEDKLDCVIDEAFFTRKTGECQAQLARLAKEIERQQNSYAPKSRMSLRFRLAP